MSDMAEHHAADFSLVATGDAMITRELRHSTGVSTAFDGLVERCRAADAAVTNLEVLVHDYSDDAYPTRSLGTFMRAPPAVVDELDWMGFNLFTTATNHSFDYGYGGIRQTIDALRSRSLTFAGMGDSLFDARRPGYLETRAGRVGLISTCTTINPGSEAAPQSETMHGSPGINPLHRERVYRVPQDQIDQLESISETLNIEQIKAEWFERGIYGGHDWLDQDRFHFMDMPFEAATDDNPPGIYDELNEADRTALLEWVRESDTNAEFTVVGIHCHESPLGFHNHPETPDFLRQFARDCIDAGADAIVGHGPHILRGIEVYDGRPIFYSLGNFIDQREHIERLPPAQYRRHGIADDTKVSAVFDARSLDADGTLKGDFANPWWWRSIIPRVDFEDGVVTSISLAPITLQGDVGRSGRGTPILARGEEARATLERVQSLSDPFGTSVTIDGDMATVDV